MSEDAVRRAEACFALARSTTFAPERETAIARGTRIAEAAGLDLDRFNIPGRTRTRPAAEALFEGHGWIGDNFRYVVIDPADLDDFVNRMAESLRRAEEVATERRRRDSYNFKAGFDDAVAFLREQGDDIHEDGGRYYLMEDNLWTILTSHDVVARARRKGWKR